MHLSDMENPILSYTFLRFPTLSYAFLYPRNPLPIKLSYTFLHFLHVAPIHFLHFLHFAPPALLALLALTAALHYPITRRNLPSPYTYPFSHQGCANLAQISTPSTHLNPASYTSNMQKSPTPPPRKPVHLFLLRIKHEAKEER
jgi:hypothetical protein